jgi:hypothetical protein
MTRIVVHIDRVVLDPAAVGGRSRAELITTLTDGLVSRLGGVPGRPEWTAAAVGRLAVTAGGARADALAEAVVRAIGGLSAPADGGPGPQTSPGRADPMGPAGSHASGGEGR